MSTDSSLKKRIRPEIELLVYCARTRMDDETALGIRRLVSGDLDWRYLFRKADLDRMVPLLWRHLAPLRRESIPQDVFDLLRRRCILATARNVQLVAGLIDLVQELASSGIQAVPFKGPALAEQAYCDIGIRDSCDLDILVDKSQIEAATDVLVSRGYGLMFRWPFARQFLREGDSFTVDLHGMFMSATFPLRLELGNLCKPLGTIGLGGKEVPAFSPEDLLLILCAHGSSHQWMRLLWICDISELIQRHEAMDWDMVRSAAKQLGIVRMLRLGLFLASDLLGAPLPPDVAREVREDRTVRGISVHVYELLLHELHMHSDLLVVKMRERLRDRIPGYLGLARRSLRRQQQCGLSKPSTSDPHRS